LSRYARGPLAVREKEPGSLKSPVGDDAGFFLVSRTMQNTYIFHNRMTFDT
jgi:hypothetical protein